MKESVLTLQRLQRRKAQERQCLHKFQAAILLQRQVRVWLSRAKFVSSKQAAVRLQKAVHSHHFKQFKSCRASAVILQHHGRGYQRRRSLCWTLGNVVLLQKSVRGWLGRIQFLSMKASALTMQCFQRRKVQDRQCLLKFQAAALIQSQVRLWISRAIYVSSKQAAVRLQNAVRSQCCQRTMVQERQDLRKFQAAILLQRQFRLWICRSTLVSSKQGAVQLQNAVRSHQGSNRFESCRAFATTLQRYARGYVHRRSLRDAL